MNDKTKVFFIGAVLVAACALAFMAFGGIGDNLVYYWTPAEMMQNRDKAQGATIRLGGVVEAGSLNWDKEANELRFVVTDGDTKVPVLGTSVPPQMFREGIGVVVEGTLRADGVFTADTLLVKHDNQYQAPEDGSAPDMDALKKSLTSER